MTSSDSTSDNARSDLSSMLRHAGSVLVGQLAVMAFSITDTIVAGRFSSGALAALSVASAIYISAYVSLIGVLQSLLPVYAELHGARRYPELGRNFRQSFYLAFILALLGMSVMLWPKGFLQWGQVPLELISEITHYLAILAWTLPATLGFRMYAALNQGLGKPLFVTWLQIGALAVKVPLTIWLAFGGAGVSAMGLAGCAWASFIVSWLILACAIVMMRTQTLYHPLQLWTRFEAPDWPLLKQFTRTGLPGGLAYLVEITSFTLMALFVARLGVDSAAGHQIAANMTGTLYMLPLSLSIACSARVSFWMGASQLTRANRVARLGLLCALMQASLTASLLYTFAHPIAALYSSNPAVITMGAQLLAWVALYHVADALQSISAFVLRCYRVTLTPLAIYGVLLWGFGLYGGYLLAYEGVLGIPAMLHAQAFWVAGTIALAAVALIFLLILIRLTTIQPVP